MSDGLVNPFREITQQLEPRLFIDAVMARWHYLVICAVVVPVAAVIYAILTPPQYAARAIIRVQSETSLEAILETRSDQFAVNSRIPVVLEVLNSRPVAREILLELGTIHPGDVPNWVDLQIDLFHQRLQVFPASGGIVQIRYRSSDPDEVVRCIRLLMDELREAMVAPQVEALDASASFLASQLERIRTELEELESEMLAFHGESSNQRPEVYDATLEHYSSLLSNFATAQNDLVAAEERLRLARNRLADYDPQRSELERRLSAARRELSSLQNTYTDGHPEVIAAQRTLENRQAEFDAYVASPEDFEIEDIERILARNRSDELLQEELSGYREALNEVEGLRQQVEFMSAQIQESLASLAAFAESSQTLANLQRETEAKSAVYTRLLAQHEEALVTRELTQHEEARQVWIIEQPDESDPPERVKVGIKKAGVAGVFAGFLLGGFLIAVAEFFGKTVRTPREASRVGHGVPVIGVLPPIEEPAEA